MKKIGVLASTPKNDFNMKYITFIYRLGGVPILIPYKKKYKDEEVDKILSEVDCLLLTGGIDVSPRTYGKDVVESQRVNHLYDLFQIGFLNAAYMKNKKIFGICRGHQLINIYFGGTLIQDISTYFDEKELYYNLPEHQQSSSSIERHELIHKIHSVPNTNIPKYLHQWNNIYTNSLHHQGIVDKILGNQLIPLFKTGEIIEVMISENKQVLSVQFHPEEFNKDDRKVVITAIQVFLEIEIEKGKSAKHI